MVFLTVPEDEERGFEGFKYNGGSIFDEGEPGTRNANKKIVVVSGTPKWFLDVA